jgi:hypothetical protein
LILGDWPSLLLCLAKRFFQVVGYCSLENWPRMIEV